MIRGLKERWYSILEETEPGDRRGRAVNYFLIILITMNSLAVILETEDGLYRHYRLLFDTFTYFSIGIFSIEYALRLWTADVNPKFSDPIRGRLRFALTPMALIDLMVIMPFFLPVFFPDLRFLRGIRIFWLFRLLKIGRYSESLSTIERVIRLKSDQLIVTFLAILFFLVFASSLIYFLEHSAQPKAFPSILATMWWSVLTLTTIGPSVYPITPLGKLIGSFIIIVGVGMFAIPTGILTSGFVEELEREQKEAKASEDKTKVCEDKEPQSLE